MPDPIHAPAGMPASGKLLTITIPTYNRATYVEKLLNSLQWEFDRMDRGTVEQVEIITANNNSTDQTSLVLERIKKELSNLEVITQPRNVGPYENMLSCMAQAKGRWIWLHGDDDISVPLGFAALLRILQKDEADYVILYDKNFKRPFSGEFRGSIREFVRFCSEKEPYLLLEHSLITSNVFKKELLDPQEMRRWNDTDYGHLYSLMRGALEVNARVCVPEFDVFHVPEERPPFECWPKNIDESWCDYLRWLSGKSGVEIDTNRAMEYTRSRLKSELRHPLRFVRKNYLNLFRPGAYPFLFKRLMTLFYKKN